MLFIHNAVKLFGLMGGRQSHVDLLTPPATFIRTNKTILERHQPLLVCVCYIFLVKSAKISVRIRLVGLGSQIKELKIN